MRLEQTLDRLHFAVTRNRLLQLFTAFTRVLLGIGFIFPSIPKIMYRRFTMLPDSNPIGHYFNALYETGFYYQFIGWSQLIAAILLLIPRTSHIGALMFLPIILNITVLTNSVGFKGTWLLTIFMSLASFYLVCWDYDRWKSILFDKSSTKSKLIKYELFLIPGLFGLGGVLIFLFLSILNVGRPLAFQIGVLAFLSVLGFLFGIAVVLHHKFMRMGDLKNSSSDDG